MAKAVEIKWSTNQPSKFVLTWGNDHSLHLFRGTNQRGLLMLHKGNGNNQVVPVDISRLMPCAIRDAWDKRHDEGKEGWNEIFVDKGPPYVAIRVISISAKVHLVWYVYHDKDVNQNDTPADVCEQWIDCSTDDIVRAYLLGTAQEKSFSLGSDSRD